MIKFLKKLWNKLWGKKELPVVEVEPVQSTRAPTPRPTHCATHKRFKKSCLACQGVI